MGVSAQSFEVVSGSVFFCQAQDKGYLAVGELGLFYRKILLIGYANLYENFLTLYGPDFGKQINGNI